MNPILKMIVITNLFLFCITTVLIVYAKYNNDVEWKEIPLVYLVFHIVMNGVIWGLVGLRFLLEWLWNVL